MKINLIMFYLFAYYNKYKISKYKTFKFNFLLYRKKSHFSIHNLPYTYPHWLYDVFIYLVYYVGGYRGIYISTIVLFFFILFLFSCVSSNSKKFLKGILLITLSNLVNSLIYLSN